MRMRRTYARFRAVLGLLILSLALVTPATAARVVAIGDLHGNLERFRAALREAALVDAKDRWIGGKAVLVQTGDILDRGANSRGIMDLLMSLQQQASAAGGQVIPLLGNHEVINIMGGLSYVSAAEWASYADADSEARREAAYQDYAKWFKRRYTAGEPQSHEQWLAEHPRGFVEQREAFGPNGKYGKWLRQHDAVAQVGDTIFLHGGIDPAAVPLSVKQLNDGVNAGLRLFDAGRDLLLKRGAILPFFTLQEIGASGVEELAADRKQLAALEAQPGGGDRNLEDALRQDISLMEKCAALRTSLLGDAGPLWFRGFATWSDAEGEAALAKLLAAFQARRFVVGHTPQPGHINSRWGGRVFLIDTSYSQPNVPGGQVSALEIDGAQVTAIYQGERALLVPGSGQAPAATVSERPETKGGAVQEAAAPAAPVWLDVNGKPLPFKNDQELLEFLRTAEVVSEKSIPQGVTGPRKLTLAGNGVQAHAVFRTVNEEKTTFTPSVGPTEFFFRDSYLFEPAAYEMSRLLGLDNVPPATLRRYHGQDGSIQIWVENATTEEARKKSKTEAPDSQRWNKQWQIMVVFDALIYNTDRNNGNVLYTPDWKLWMIDHTRAFRRQPELQDEKKLVRCERALYQRLKALQESAVRERLKEYIRPEEIKSLLKRRDRIVKLLDRLMAEKGEGAVLYDMGQ